MASRVLAPLALVVTALVLAFIIAGSGVLRGDSQTTTVVEKGSAKKATTTNKQSSVKRVYRVKAGDSLSGIAEREGVKVSQLIDLNPDVDPNSLVTGQKIKLR